MSTAEQAIGQERSILSPKRRREARALRRREGRRPPGTPDETVHRFDVSLPYPVASACARGAQGAEHRRLLPVPGGLVPQVSAASVGPGRDRRKAILVTVTAERQAQLIGFEVMSDHVHAHPLGAIASSKAMEGRARGYAPGVSVAPKSAADPVDQQLLPGYGGRGAPWR